MSIFKNITTLVLTLLFFSISISAAYAQGQAPDMLDRPQNSQQDESPIPTTTMDRLPVDMQNIGQPVDRVQQNTNERFQQNLEQFQTRRETLRRQIPENTERINTIKQEQQQRIEMLREKQNEMRASRGEHLQERFNQIQIQQLRGIQNRLIMTTARFSRAIQHLYGILDRIDVRLTELEDSGFSYSDQRAALSNIESEILSVELDIESLSLTFDELENPSPNDVTMILMEVKEKTRDVTMKLNNIRVSIVTLVRQI